jgi:hypothetical protein
MIREVVDEKCEDISEFLRCVHDHSLINGKFRVTIRLLPVVFRVELCNASEIRLQIPGQLLIYCLWRVYTQVELGVSFANVY